MTACRLGEPLKAGVLPPSIEPDWTRLLDSEAELGAQIAAEVSAAQARIEAARAAAAAAVPDTEALAALSAAQEQAGPSGIAASSRASPTRPMPPVQR